MFFAKIAQVCKK